jgi:hypothetical protein
LYEILPERQPSWEGFGGKFSQCQHFLSRPRSAAGFSAPRGKISMKILIKVGSFYKTVLIRELSCSNCIKKEIVQNAEVSIDVRSK